MEKTTHTPLDTRAGCLVTPVADDYRYWEHPLNEGALATDMKHMFRQYGIENILDCTADCLDLYDGELDDVSDADKKLASKLREAATLARNINESLRRKD